MLGTEVKTLMLGKTEGKRRRRRQRMRWLDSISDSVNMNSSKLQKMVKDKEASGAESMGSQRVGHNLATEHHHHHLESPKFQGSVLK